MKKEKAPNSLNNAVSVFTLMNILFVGFNLGTIENGSQPPIWNDHLIELVSAGIAAVFAFSLITLIYKEPRGEEAAQVVDFLKRGSFTAAALLLALPWIFADQFPSNIAIENAGAFFVEGIAVARIFAQFESFMAPHTPKKNSPYPWLTATASVFLITTTAFFLHQGIYHLFGAGNAMEFGNKTVPGVIRFIPKLYAFSCLVLVTSNLYILLCQERSLPLYVLLLTSSQIVMAILIVATSILAGRYGLSLFVEGMGSLAISIFGIGFIIVAHLRDTLTQPFKV